MQEIATLSFSGNRSEFVAVLLQINRLTKGALNKPYSAEKISVAFLSSKVYDELLQSR